MGEVQARGLAQTLTAFARGRYTLLKVLGAGGEKIVYLVHDQALDRECALALLRPGELADEARERLRTEARAIARLGSHPHVVTVFDIGEHDGVPFVVSEHLGGGDLTAALQEAGGKFPVERVLDVARQLLRALDFVHARGIVHRDIKPDNVWLMPDGTVKLGDFGIAYSHRDARTTAPQVVGTPLYMAPEQIRGEPVDGRTDLYALGCLLFELLTGKPPFDGTLSDVLAAHVSKAPPELGPDALVIEPLVRALLAKAPGDRPASAAAAHRMLDDTHASISAPLPAQPMDWQAEVRALMARGDVRAAIELLRARLATAPDPEVRISLGALLHITAQSDASREQFELAFRELSEAGNVKRAALAAAWIATSYQSGTGNRVASRPWLARAWRLVNGEGPCLERGWVAILDVGCNVDDPAELREKADIALEMAQRFQDVDLEAKALADSGLALVEAGFVNEGIARLDESMSIVTSGALKNRMIGAQALCAFFTACACTSDLARCESWSRVFRERGLVGDKAPPVITAHCDSVYGGLLCRLGRWNEAEATLERAIQIARVTHYGGRLHPLGVLAELRIEQGRLDEAAKLLEGHVDHMEALIPAVRLHLLRGELDLAATLARRGIRALGADRTRSIGLLSALVDIELRRGNMAAADAACAELDARVSGTKLPALAAEASIVRARLHAAHGEREAAIQDVESALASCAKLDLPPLNVRLHVALARLHGSDDPTAALVEARAAAAICARANVALAGDDLEFLESLGVTLRPAATNETLDAGSVDG